MKNEKISLEIATLKKALLKDMPKVVKAKIEAKIVALEKELKGSTQTGVEFAKSLLSGKRKVKAMAKVDFNSLIKSLSKKPEYDFLKYLTRKQIEDDLDREAKPVGYRYVGRKNFKIPTKADIKAKRGVYYENRSNRTDVNRSVRLAKGGDTRGEFGTFVYEIYGNGILKEEGILKAGYSNLIKEMAMDMSKKYTNPSVRVRKLSKKEYEDGGMMAKGGLVKHGLKVGDEILHSADNMIIVKSMNGKYFAVNLNKGTRVNREKLGKMNNEEMDKFMKLENGGEIGGME
jgi:hypothetical protein